MALFIFDFDGNAFKTSHTDGSDTRIIDVGEAYKRAVGDIFGEEGARLYEQLGGHRNNAPSEVARKLFTISPNPDILLTHAHDFYQRHKGDLISVVSEGKGVSIDVWDQSNQEKILAELLVRRKLQILLPQIGLLDKEGQPWPSPCKGFVEFWSFLNSLQQEGVDVRTAILSSGHDEFIRRVWDMYHLSPAHYMVTEDDVRGRSEDLSRRVKPGLLQLAMIHRQWLSDLNLVGNRFSYQDAVQTREHMIYFGDDYSKDGLMAQRAGIPFGHYCFEGGWMVNESRQMIQFGDWLQVASVLEVRKQGLLEGQSPREIFFEHRIVHGERE